MSASVTSQTKTYQVRRSISLPIDVDDRLTALAADHDGNRSAAVAELVKQAPTPVPEGVTK